MTKQHRQLRALDLFCGAGGASLGLAAAGFEVVGIDLKRQPRYPFTFNAFDALRLTLDELRLFDLIWASPPCQAHTAMRRMHNAKPHVDLIPPTRAMLRAAAVPYVIENVVGAPLEDPIILCGTMFGLGVHGAELRRHRLFEASFPIPAPPCRHGLKPATIGVYGGHVRNRKRREGSHARGVEDFSIAAGREAMGINHMTLAEMSEAIPPAYSEWIGLAARMAIMTKAKENPDANLAA